MSKVSCAICKQAFDFEDAYLGDEGIMCTPCCIQRHPSMFKCNCGSCFQCLNPHDHEWKTYIGFRDVFEYCDCGEKKRDRK